MSSSILSYLQIFNILITVFLNFSQIFVFIPVIKGKQKYTNIPFLMLIFNLLNCICWACYWFRKNVISPVISNAICLIISTMFFLIYIFFFSKKIVTKFLFYIIILILIETIIIFISLYVINLNFFGIILIVMNSLMFIAPGQNIIRVIKEKNYKLIPIATTLVAIICSGGWLLFGILVNDINCIISNLIGLVSSIFTTLIWVIYYLRSKIIRNKNKFYQEENIDNKNVEIR